MIKARIAIACQGGGSQTAFTAGVLHPVRARLRTELRRARRSRVCPPAGNGMLDGSTPGARGLTPRESTRSAEGRELAAAAGVREIAEDKAMLQNPAQPGTRRPRAAERGPRGRGVMDLAPVVSLNGLRAILDLVVPSWPSCSSKVLIRVLQRLTARSDRPLLGWGFGRGAGRRTGRCHGDLDAHRLHIRISSGRAPGRERAMTPRIIARVAARQRRPVPRRPGRLQMLFASGALTDGETRSISSSGRRLGARGTLHSSFSLSHAMRRGCWSVRIIARVSAHGLRLIESVIPLACRRARSRRLPAKTVRSGPPARDVHHRGKGADRPRRGTRRLVARRSDSTASSSSAPGRRFRRSGGTGFRLYGGAAAIDDRHKREMPCSGGAQPGAGSLFAFRILVGHRHQGHCRRRSTSRRTP